MAASLTPSTDNGLSEPYDRLWRLVDCGAAGPLWLRSWSMRGGDHSLRFAGRSAGTNRVSDQLSDYGLPDPRSLVHVHGPSSRLVLALDGLTDRASG